MDGLGLLYPVNLVLTDRPVLVVGGGNVARQKIPELLLCGAAVHVVAPMVSSEVRSLDVTWEERPYRPGEVASYDLAITCTDDAEVNRAVRQDGDEHRVWVNSADDPANCAFTLPSRIRQGPLLVTFSTAGRSPALSTWLRRRFTDEFGPEYGTLIDLLTEERDRIRGRGESTEGLDWQSALDSGMLEMIREGRLAEAKERLQACLSS